MAKLSIIHREKKRERTVQRFAAKRAELKKKLKDPSVSAEEKEALWKKFHAMPRNASPCRLRNRCRLTGRPHGYYRKFGLSRNKLREAMMRGDVPGLTKASW